MTGDSGIDFAEAERLLLESEFEDCRPLWWSSNYVYLAQLCPPGGGQSFAAVYKPRQGEAPLWDFPEGSLYRREVAAYRLSQLLGWGFIPPTVMRDGPQGIGALQVFVPHDQASHFFEQKEIPNLVPQLQRMLVFDYVSNNADRKGGHCLLDAEGRLWGIDHGLCFHPQYKMRTVMWDWAEQPIAEEWLRDVEKALDQVEAEDQSAAPLLEVLEGRERAAMVERGRHLVAVKEFPRPGPHRSYPWPLV